MAGRSLVAGGTMWRSRKTWLASALCVITLLMTCTLVVRHRHAGGASHSHGGHRHSHAHSHSHTHQGHSHSHRHDSAAEQNDGWHVHLLGLGWEFTIWEGGFEVVRVATSDDAPGSDEPDGVTVFAASDLLTAGGGGGWWVGVALALLLGWARGFRCGDGPVSIAMPDVVDVNGGRSDEPPVRPPRKAKALLR